LAILILVLRSGHNGDDLLDYFLEDLDDGCNDRKGAHLVVPLTLLPVVVVVVVAAATEEGAQSTERSTFSSLAVVVIVTIVVIVVVVVIIVAVVVVVVSTHAEEGAQAAEGALEPLSLGGGDLPGVDFVEDLEELGYLFNGAGLLSFFDRARGDMVDGDGEESDNQEGPHDGGVH